MLTVLLGGFIYPSTSLPDLISYLSDLIPGKHMVEITRMVLGSATLEVDTLLVHLFLRKKAQAMLSWAFLLNYTYDSYC